MKGQIFTYLLTATGVVNGLFYPFIGVTAYVCLAIMRPEFMWPWSVSPGGSYSFYVGSSLLLGWAMHGFGTWRLGKGGWVVTALMAYYGWMILSYTQARNQENAWELITFFAKVYLPFLAGVGMVRNVTELKILAWTIVLSMGYLAFELNLSYVGGYNKVWEEGFGGMDNNCVAIAMVTAVGFAFFLGMGTNRWWVACIAFGCAAMMGHVILLTYSRGGMLALVVCMAMAFWLIPKKPKHYAFLILGVLMMVKLAGPKVQERFISAFNKKEGGDMEASAQSRVDLWRDATDAAMKEPLLGVGPDSWGAVAPEYGWPRGKEVHSLWVQNSAEVGYPGVAFLFLFFASICWFLWPMTREDSPVPDPWMRDAARMVVAGVIGFIVSAQFVTIKYLELPYYVVMLGVGLLKIQTEFARSGMTVPGSSTPAGVPMPWAYLPRIRRPVLNPEPSGVPVPVHSH